MYPKALRWIFRFKGFVSITKQLLVWTYSYHRWWRCQRSLCWRIQPLKSLHLMVPGVLPTIQKRYAPQLGDQTCYKKTQLVTCRRTMKYPFIYLDGEWYHAFTAFANVGQHQDVGWVMITMHRIQYRPFLNQRPGKVDYRECGQIFNKWFIIFDGWLV